MKKYYEAVDGYKPDQLRIDGGVPFEVWNVKVSGEVERGDLICSADATGTFKAVSAASDANKILLIAAGGGSDIVQAYASGVFFEDKINFGSLSAANFAAELRRQNIMIRGGISFTEEYDPTAMKR